ncbi:rhythmically expressed gene 5 protein isoform X2 [Ischnura elegans]|uniref:rhythmically expressed gene 5 protein isoform X2 n=1 Tax=Ischnura elegans TaxID=197161 RepID=UPI001ED883C1|nr:rhythmically expressed gene 5 protein isoform X2 [Ischnura elegans]
MARLRCALCCPVAVCLVLGSLLAGAQGSAIPMWEFLSRSEKMSRLFNVFVKQVEGYCGESSMPDCNKALILYGMTNLAKMEDHHLDTMDPYQRGASDIIWDSMMKGSFEMPDEKRPQDFYVSNPSTGSNLLREGDDYPSDKGSSGSASNQFSDYATPPETISYHPLGPMMVRVMPDGGPVPGDGPQHYPKDEDAEEYALLRSRFLLPPHESAKKSKQSTSESTEKNVKSSGQSSQGSSDSIGQYRYMLVK